mmetsp:Transcript_22318/g.67897  ORF Transcript_22318/g.67897 Transcript_22318/m.67897 type:complete len:82 (-) Transcript_22318:506-751(-)
MRPPICAAPPLAWSAHSKRTSTKVLSQSTRVGQPAQLRNVCPVVRASLMCALILTWPRESSSTNKSHWEDFLIHPAINPKI